MQYGDLLTFVTKEQVLRNRRVFRKQMTVGLVSPQVKKKDPFHMATLQEDAKTQNFFTFRKIKGERIG